MDPLIILAYLAILLMVGVLCSFVSKELKLPYNLILILLGFLLGSLFFSGIPIVNIDKTVILGIGTLSLILLVFDSASRMRADESSKEAVPVVRLINMFTLLSVLVVTFFTANLFFAAPTLTAILYSLLLSVLVVETDFGSVLLLFKDFAKARAKKLLLFMETEADLNTAFVIVLPFVVLSLIRNIDYEAQSLFSALLTNLPVFLYEILVAIGVGILVGLILLKILRNWYDSALTPITLITACLIAYVMTEMLDGNGIIAVAIMGFLFGNVYVQGKEQLFEFSKLLTSSLEIFIFVLLGIAVRPAISLNYVLMSLLLFVIILCVRFLAVFLALEDKEFTFREKIFFASNMPKGIALATVLLYLSTYNIYGLNVILQLALMIMIYSIVLSFILDFYAAKILHEQVRVLPSQNGINVLDQAFADSEVSHAKRKHVAARASSRRSATRKSVKRSSKSSRRARPKKKSQSRRSVKKHRSQKHSKKSKRRR